MSKEIVVTASRLSPAASPGRRRMALRKLLKARWVTATPLGRPVEPEVKIMYATLSGAVQSGRGAALSAPSAGPSESRRSVATGAAARRDAASRFSVNTSASSASPAIQASRSAGKVGSSGR